MTSGDCLFISKYEQDHLLVRLCLTSVCQFGVVRSKPTFWGSTWPVPRRQLACCTRTFLYTLVLHVPRASNIDLIGYSVLFRLFYQECCIWDTERLLFRSYRLLAPRIRQALCESGGRLLVGYSICILVMLIT